MKNRKFLIGIASAMVGLAGLSLFGCQGKNSALSPVKLKVAAMKVKIPGKSIRSALINNATGNQNELIYRLDSFWFDPIEATIGPFSTPATGGEYDFDVDMPIEDDIVLSIQLNDATTHQPLAVGATGIDLVDFPTADVEVDMGSVTRNCYYTQSFPMPNGGSYNFATDALGNTVPATAGLADIQILPVQLGAPVTIQDAQYSPPGYTIAYLGNGNLVDFDYVPDGSYFYPDSYSAEGGPLQVGDVFCIALSSIPPLATGFNDYAYAWIQITDPGGSANLNGPSFIFRTCSYEYFYQYEQTPIDINSGGVCNLGW